MEAALQDEEGDSYDYECTDDDISENYVSKHTDGIHEDSDADVNSPTNEVLNMVQAEQQQQQYVHEAQPDGNVVTSLSYDPILHNMRTRRVKASSMSIPESRQEEVCLISQINKGRVVAKGKLVTTDSWREILGTKLGTEYSGVYVEGLENIEWGNKGDKEIPRPFDQIRTLIDAIGYVIPWPTTHVKKAKSSSPTRNKLVPAARGQS